MRPRSEQPVGAANAPRPSQARRALPPRVQAQLAAHRRHTQVLTGWVQLGIVGLFAALYAVAPKAFTSSAPFEPVPLVLGAYAPFTLFRLALAYRRELPPWVLVLSAVLDMAILMATIWSFHLQYEQPAAFYLKAPTLLYVFIFIALRALSYRPAYVLASGAAAAVGWLVLVVYAVSEPDGAARVTRDYVAYMTDARILIGAEIDKIVSIVVVTLLLAYAVARSRRLLESAVAEQTAADTLARFLAPEVAESLRNAADMPRLGDGVEREATVMFIDLRGFTRFAATVPARQTIALLRAYQAIAVPIVHRHGGTITTYLGDGIMVVFGGMRPSRTSAADAIRAARDLLAAFQTWTRQRAEAGLPALVIGIGIDSGTVVCGPVGDEQRLEFAVIGDPVNRAAKLQQHTKAAGTPALASAYTYRLAIEQGYADPGPGPRRRAQAPVEGIGTQVEVVYLSA